MPVNLKKQKDKVENIPSPIIITTDERFCEYCRWHRVSWLGFCCIMLGMVIPFAIVSFTDISEIEANIFLIVTALIALIVYFYMRPIEIKKADKQFKDMNYRDHIHI